MLIGHLVSKSNYFFNSIIRIYLDSSDRWYEINISTNSVLHFVLLH